MVLNPDDLLIFKVREEEKEEQTKGKKAPAKQPQKAQQQTKIEEPEPELYNKQSREEEFLIAEELRERATSENYTNIAMQISGGDGSKEEEKKAPRGRMDSRKLAATMNCDLHPWRRAYAICDYCKRPFCYEDIIQSGGKYYCIDDISKVPEAARRLEAVRYNNLGVLSSLLYIAAFIVFIFYAYPAVLALLTTAVKMGIVTFIGSIDITDALLLAESILAIVSLFGGIGILMTRSSSFKTSAMVSIIGVAVFSYQYINLNVTYLAVVAALVFVAFVTLAYSRVSYEELNQEEEMLEIEPGVGPRTLRSSF